MCYLCHLSQRKFPTKVKVKAFNPTSRGIKGNPTYCIGYHRAWSWTLKQFKGLRRGTNICTKRSADFPCSIFAANKPAVKLSGSGYIPSLIVLDLWSSFFFYCISVSYVYLYICGLYCLTMPLTNYHCALKTLYRFVLRQNVGECANKSKWMESFSKEIICEAITAYSV